MRRAVPLVLLLLCLALPAGAIAQSNPFGPLPPADGPPPAEDDGQDPVAVGDDDFSVGTLWIIGGAVIVIFFGIGWYITRDARAHLTEDDRRAIDREQEAFGLQERRTRSDSERKKHRARSKAQKQARKKQRARR